MVDAEAAAISTEHPVLGTMKAFFSLRNPQIFHTSKLGLDCLELDAESEPWAAPDGHARRASS